jgi:hypothetical protein
MLARCTFVLDRSTADRLAYVASRMGQSRSQLVRDVLRDPVELMHKMMSGLPEEPTETDLRQMALVGLNGITEHTDNAIPLLHDLVKGS